MKKNWIMLFRGMKRRRFGSIALVIAAAILSFAVFGGFILTISLKNGVESTDKRLGADMMIVPDGYKESAESVLLAGSRDYFYFDKVVLEEIEDVAGISAATPQFFLASLSEKCCTDKVGIVGFEPETDFIIKPWIEEVYNGELPDNEAVVGSDISLEDDGTIKLFGEHYKVAARLAKTATSIDTSVYFTLNTIPKLLADAKKNNLNFLDSQKDLNSISTVFVKLEGGQTALDVTKAIHENCSQNVGIVYPKEIVQSLSGNLSYIVLGMKIFVGVAAVISITVLFILYLVSSNGRKREMALLRAMGCTHGRLTGIMLEEACVLNLTGCAAGSVLAAAVVFPFGRYIGRSLHMPYLCPGIGIVMGIFFGSLVVVLLAGMAASAYPALRISRIEPYAALREEE